MLLSPARTPSPLRDVDAPRAQYTTPLRRKALLGDTDAASHLVEALKRFQERMANHTAVHEAYVEWHRLVGAVREDPKEAWFLQQMAHLECKYGLLLDAGAGNAEGCAAVQDALRVLRSAGPLPAHLDAHVWRKGARSPPVALDAWVQQREARVAALSRARLSEAKGEVAERRAAAADALHVLRGAVPPPVARRRPTERAVLPPRAQPPVDVVVGTILRNAGPAALWAVETAGVGGGGGAEGLAPKRSRTI